MRVTKMNSKTTLLFSLLFIFSVPGSRAHPTIFDVTRFGAKQNSEICTAVMDAWKAACACTTPSQVLIPKGEYTMGQIEFAGPCKAPIEVKIDGYLRAPVDPSRIPKGKQWITASRLNGFTLSGCGTLDGMGGAKAWAMNVPGKGVKKDACLQYNLSFNFLNNSLITGITSKDSKSFHSNVMTCCNLTFDNFHIIAPDESPNTDGIHLGWSRGITIRNSLIATGDDCISIGDGNENVRIEGVTCGPGHGISIGSLGKYPGEKPVIGVFVKNSTFIRTENGVRIKTWPNSRPGEVRDAHFEDLVMDQVGNPIIVEQEYCPHNKCTKEKPSLVKISKISFKNIRGSGTCAEVVKLLCSPATKCEGVELSNIDLTYTGRQGPAIQTCSNTKPVFSGRQNPAACVA